MKKVILVMLMVIFVLGILTSCNKNVCPAYVLEDDTEQVENNS